MKHLIILGDGMADEPCPELGNMTPLQAANTPNFDRLAREGVSGLLATVPDGFEPGSEIAHLSLLGYNVAQVFEGRGSLEAASMGIDIEPGEVAMRCNLICIDQQGRIKNHSAGHITTAEARELIEFLNANLGGDGSVNFYTGVSYRHLLKIKDADKHLCCTPPHDVPGTLANQVLPKAASSEAESTATLLNNLIARSQTLLKDHPVNLRRIERGLDPANSIWPWSPGYKPQMTPMTTNFGVKSGAVISAVDLILGIGVYAGLKPITVEGATGLPDTNYEGKARAAINALRNGADFVFLHVEAPDEAGHEGNAQLKAHTIEDLDSRILATVLAEADTLGEPLAVALMPDHPTPCRIRTHTNHPIPVTIWAPGRVPPDVVTHYNETSCAAGSLGAMHNDQFIRYFLSL